MIACIASQATSRVCDAPTQELASHAISVTVAPCRMIPSQRPASRSASRSSSSVSKIRTNAGSDCAGDNFAEVPTATSVCGVRVTRSLARINSSAAAQVTTSAAPPRRSRTRRALRARSNSTNVRWRRRLRVSGNNGTTIIQKCVANSRNVGKAPPRLR